MHIFEKIYQQKDLHIVVDEIFKSCSNVQIITLQGSLGAGKTTLAIELLERFGVYGEKQSPTYTYVQIYKNDAGKNFYHFDVYRLPHKNAFLFAGFDEFLYQQNSVALIEWPEIIEDLISHNVCRIVLEYVDDTTRKISWSLS